MANIYYEKDTYAAETHKLESLNEEINPVFNLNVSIGHNVSDVAQAYYDMYVDILKIVRLYKWSVQHSIESFEQVGELLEETDENAGVPLD